MPAGAAVANGSAHWDRSALFRQARGAWRTPTRFTLPNHPVGYPRGLGVPSVRGSFGVRVTFALRIMASGVGGALY